MFVHLYPKSGKKIPISAARQSIKVFSHQQYTNIVHSPSRRAPCQYCAPCFNGETHSDVQNIKHLLVLFWQMKLLKFLMLKKKSVNSVNKFAIEYQNSEIFVMDRYEYLVSTIQYLSPEFQEESGKSQSILLKSLILTISSLLHI